MNKKILIVCFIVCLIVCSIYLVYNTLLPKAPKIEYPDYSSIESIKVYRDNGDEIHLSDEEYRALYNHIKTAKPTRKTSVNDVPVVDTCFSVFFKPRDVLGFEYGYIYQENEIFYFEIPYVGVYKFEREYFIV